MSRLLAALSLAFPLSGALAVNPTDQLVEEIVELSKQVGDQGEVVGDQKDFAEALRRIASDRPEGGGWQAPPPQPTNRVAWPESGGTGPDPSGRNLVGATWPPSVANPYGERPHGPTPPARKPPHIMLREAAFQLDRIAHELEMTELFAEADALRGPQEAAQATERAGQGLGASPDTTPNASSTGATATTGRAAPTCGRVSRRVFDTRPRRL